jgi:hypothetical protein
MVKCKYRVAFLVVCDVLELEDFKGRIVNQVVLSHFWHIG